MFFRKCTFSNNLSDFIAPPKLDVETLILHKDFKETLESTTDIFFDKILENKGEFLLKIIDYALFDHKPPICFQRLNEVNQINHNSAFFLSDCNPYFYELLRKNEEFDGIDLIQKAIDMFISPKNKTNQNSMYAGHFSRFFKKVLKNEILKNCQDQIMKKIIPFLTINSRILSYQRLFFSILKYYVKTNDNIIVNYILETILHISFQCVKYIQTSEEKNDETIFSKEKFKEENQPFNLSKKSIPIWPLTLNHIENNLLKKDLKKQIKWKHNKTFNYEKKLQKEDAEMVSYLLLMFLRQTIVKHKDYLLDYFIKDEENEYIFIQALFYCGTHCNSKSLISLEAFKILNVIFSNWKQNELDRNDLDFYQEYADSFVFDPQNLTSQMVNAFPIFWNHRYNEKSYKLSSIEKEQFDVSDYFNDKKSKVVLKRENGETAFEILQPFLFGDPPISSTLIYHSVCVLSKMSEKRNELNNIKNKTKTIRNQIVSIDFTILNFILHHFSAGNIKDKNIKDCFNELFPLSPSDEIYLRDSNKRRAILNCFLHFFLSNQKFYFIIDNSFKKLSENQLMDIQNLINYGSIPYFGIKVLNQDEKPVKKKKLKISVSVKPIENSSDSDDEKTVTNNICTLNSDFIIKLHKVKKIGEGATSNVFKVKIPEEYKKKYNESFYALKVLKLDIIKMENDKTAKIKSWSDESDDDDDDTAEKKETFELDIKKIKKFFGEYEFISNLNNNNIIKSFGFFFGDKENPPSILLEYFPRNLHDHIKLLDEIDLIVIIYEICKVMKYVHKKGAIHRDLKPENILLDKEKHIKLCDFGIATLIKAETQSTFSRTVGVGTPYYMAPELFQENGKYDHKVDVYAFGMILYFIISKGELPKFTLIDKMSGKIPKIPDDFCDFSRKLISKCWNFNAKDRPEFKDIILMIEKNGFGLFDGVDKEISSIKKRLQI